MTTISSVNSQNIPIVPAGTSAGKLDQSTFLQLMTTQLKAQDPFNPVNNEQMVAQMAQFSSLAGISEMNTTLRDIAAHIEEQTTMLSDLRSSLSPQTSSTTPTV